MIDRRIEDKLRSLGLTSVYQGYFCLVHAVLLAEEDPLRLTLVTKWLYPDVAQRCNMTPSKLDSAFRSAIQRCWRCDRAAVARMCGVDQQPTVAQFISGLVASLQEGSAR